MSAKKRSIMYTDVVYSPDDGGYYLQQYNNEDVDTRVSKKTFSSASAARSAMEAGKVVWETWS